MTKRTPKRVPHGVPAGGQFAADRKEAPTSSLTSHQPALVVVAQEQEYLYEDTAERADYFRDVLSYGTTRQRLMLCREDDLPHDVVEGLMEAVQPVQVRAAAVSSQHPTARGLGIIDSNPVIRMLSGALEAQDHDGVRARALLAS